MDIVSINTKILKRSNIPLSCMIFSTVQFANNYLASNIYSLQCLPAGDISLSSTMKRFIYSCLLSGPISAQRRYEESVVGT